MQQQAWALVAQLRAVLQQAQAWGFDKALLQPASRALSQAVSSRSPRLLQLLQGCRQGELREFTWSRTSKNWYSDRKWLMRALADEELDTLCFAFGVELDEVSEEDGEKIFKIDVPANRYDLLCVEGLGRALRVFTSSAPLETIPCLRLSGDPTICVTVKPSVSPAPHAAAADAAAAAAADGLAEKIYAKPHLQEQEGPFASCVPPSVSVSPSVSSSSVAAAVVSSAGPSLLQAEGPRPYIACAVLRGVKLNPRRLSSFIELQDKLHHTLCRQARRTLASIGTYDMQQLHAPFTYEALPPEQVVFQPLGCGALPPMTGGEILSHFSNHTQLKGFLLVKAPVVRAWLLSPLVCVAVSVVQQYLPLLEGQPKLYVLRDSKSQVLSMPPLINSDFCRLTESSRDVFIDCTSSGALLLPLLLMLLLVLLLLLHYAWAAVEARRGELVLTLVAAMFAEYCDEAFTIEPVRIIYEQTKRVTVTPSLDPREMSVDMGIVRRICGLKDLSAEEASRQLTRLMLSARPDPQDSHDKLIVSVPPTRSGVSLWCLAADIMHACDVAEDVAIGIGFDRLPVVVAPKLASNPRSLLSQSLRTLLTSLGFTECLTFALCSAEENAEALSKPRHPPLDPTPNYNPLEGFGFWLQHQWLGQPVLLSNAKTRELTETRAQLISGILKALANNVGRREMPLKFFEVGDVVLRDDRTETKTRNLLYCCAAYADEHGSGLEEVHGLLDATMEALGFVGDYAVAERQAALAAGKEEHKETLRSLDRMSQFSLKPTNLPSFLPGRQVEILAHRQRNTSSSSSDKRSDENTAKETQSLRIGHMGTLHVDCLRAFGLALPVSVVELTLEPFLEWLPETDLIFAGGAPPGRPFEA
ncbi:hypothetical protein Emag_002906 [Eimeria magna]